MKYIDAYKLIAKIRRIIEEKTPISKGSDYYHGAADTADTLLSFITSLQQEQPEFVNEIWHKVSEEANITRPVVLSDGDKYMSPPCTFPFKDMSGFVKAMNKRYKANYTIWAYMDDLLNISSLQQEQPEVDLEKDFEDYLNNIEGQPRMWHPDEEIEWAKDIARHFYELGLNARK